MLSSAARTVLGCPTNKPGPSDCKALKLDLAVFQDGALDDELLPRRPSEPGPVAAAATVLGWFGGGVDAKPIPRRKAERMEFERDPAKLPLLESDRLLPVLESSSVR